MQVEVIYMKKENNFWSIKIKDMKRGYLYDKKEKKYSCIFCDLEYVKGNIYAVNSSW